MVVEEETVSGPGSSHAEQAARDDAHLRSLGIKPELRRTLGFLSNFAIAFSFISVSTGSFGNFGVGIKSLDNKQSLQNEMKTN